MKNLSLVALLAPLASAAILGTANPHPNCKGSMFCDYTLKCHLEDLMEILIPVGNDSVIPPHRHIACCGNSGTVAGICLFTEHLSREARVDEAKDALAGLMEYGCDTCGRYPMNDEYQKGYLKSDWVHHKHPLFSEGGDDTVLSSLGLGDTSEDENEHRWF
ncbi:MAG: hypothetical protein MMC23_005753 [Stictis urceolatum]|nr:hypothetical protein [Stictis urceolata]